MKQKSLNKIAKPLVDEENPEWTKADFAKAKGFRDLPPALQQALAARKRGPQKAPKKVAVSIRLSPEVVAAFRSSGNGWQGRIDDVLRDHIQSPPVRASVSGRNRG